MTDNPAYVAKVLLRGSAPAATVAAFTAPDARRRPNERAVQIAQAAPAVALAQVATA